MKGPSVVIEVRNICLCPGGTQGHLSGNHM